MKGLKTILSGFLLFFCLSWCAVGSCYEITETELSQLEINLTTLANINKQQSTTLKEQKSMLMQARFDLEELQNALKESKQETLQAQNSLQTANELLAKYEEENNKKIRRLKTQRIIWQIIAGGLLAYAVGRS